MSLELSSRAFDHEGEIPVRYTCQGEDLSPDLSWSNLPDGTRSLVLIVDDPDAPDPAAPKRVWVHWVLFDIAPEISGLAEGAGADPPTGTRDGLNDWGRTGYGGPCPPIGRHRYFHKLYALDTELNLAGTPTKAAVLEAMQGHVLEETVLMGTFEK
jgi:Raf kinase inhibitor-like YbhB/YbcL family protein